MRQLLNQIALYKMYNSRTKKKYILAKVIPIHCGDKLLGCVNHHAVQGQLVQEVQLQ